MELDFSAAGSNGLAVAAVGARRGNIKTGEGGDNVVWVAHSAATAGRGNDNVAVASVSRSGTDQPLAWGAEGNCAYDGRASLSRIDLGAGIDTVAFDGPASRCTAAALADGSTRVANTTGAGPQHPVGSRAAALRRRGDRGAGPSGGGVGADLSPLG